MSYYKIQSFSFNKDFTSFTTTATANNVRPYDYNKSINHKKENESSFDFVKGVIKAIISGDFQFNNKKHTLNLYVDLHLRFENINSIIDLWFSQYDFDKDYHYEKGFSSPEKEAEYNEAIENKERILDKITYSYMNNDLKDYIKDLKNDKYIIADKNFYNFVIKFSMSRFYYSHKYNKAIIINGIDKMYLPHYMFTQYDFELVNVNDTENIVTKIKEHLTAQFLDNDLIDKSIYSPEQYIQKMLPIRLNEIGLAV